jgi:hypothetical protein
MMKPLPKFFDFAIVLAVLMAIVTFLMFLCGGCATKSAVTISMPPVEYPSGADLPPSR